MPQRIAVFRIGQLGDTLAALPAITAIRKGYPAANMILITEEHAGQGFVSAWDVLKETGLFSDVLIYPAVSCCVNWWLGPERIAKIARNLRKMKPEILFYLAPSPRSAGQVRRDHLFFGVICGIPRIHGIEPRDSFIRSGDSRGYWVSAQAEADRLLSVVAKAGLPVPLPGQAKFDLPIHARERARVDHLWEEGMLGVGKPVLAFGPGSKMPAKRWPLDRFIALGARLLETYSSGRLLVFGGREDWDLGERIRNSLGTRALNWAGELSILESAEALRRCFLYVGNDTGTMHLAAAMGTRCVAIFSARDLPGKWDPYGEGHIVLRKDVPCAGCLLMVCDEREMICLKEIQVDEVFDACRRALRAYDLRPNPCSIPASEVKERKFNGHRH